ncbi:MAG TPA: hypothetical protein PL033_03310 [Candidatus Brocadiia bacterium]|nr:hypothetical protein [Candidatus Brocadiia bacterium]
MEISVAILPEAIMNPGEGAKPCATALLGELAAQDNRPIEVFVPADCAADARDLKVLRLDALSLKPERLVADFCRRAKGDILLILNAPVEIGRNDWLKTLVAEFSDEEVGAVAAPILLNRTRGIDALTAFVEAVARPGQCRVTGKPRRLDLLPMNVAALRRSVLEKAGLLKEDVKRLTPMMISTEIKAYGHYVLWQTELTVRGIGSDDSHCSSGDVTASARERGEHSANMMSAHTYDDGIPAVGLSMLVIALLPLCAFSLPLYILCIAPIFFLGWWVYGRFPLIPVEFPLGGVQLLVYGFCLAGTRVGPPAEAIPISVHPAIVRLWVIPVAMSVSFCVVMCDMTLRLTAAAIRQKCRPGQWPLLAPISAGWLIIAGWWFLRRSAHNITVSLMRSAGSASPKRSAADARD